MAMLMMMKDICYEDICSLFDVDHSSHTQEVVPQVPPPQFQELAPGGHNMSPSGPVIAFTTEKLCRGRRRHPHSACSPTHKASTSAAGEYGSAAGSGSGRMPRSGSRGGSLRSGGSRRRRRGRDGGDAEATEESAVSKIGRAHV
jgi:hypothetical protein